MRYVWLLLCSLIWNGVGEVYGHVATASSKSRRNVLRTPPPPVYCFTIYIIIIAVVINVYAALFFEVTQSVEMRHPINLKKNIFRLFHQTW